ncbi:MAG: F0F1 ATP synthase subunit delta [Robiginitomaculum sp.]|nr:F0F1 ATP synthase subunit delta [Robiginitomaculum sp.]
MSNLEGIVSLAAGRYAQALLELAQSSKSLKTVEKDLKTLKSLFIKSDDLRAMANSPVIADTDKLKALLAVAKKAKIGKLTTQFIGTVVENQRAGEIPAMITAFEQSVAALRGTQSAEIFSAKKLTPAQLSSIKTQLKKSLGRTVSVETHIDPELLGGFAVKIGSRYFDSTLKTKLEGLKMAMKEA